MRIFNDKIFQKLFERCNYSKLTDMEKKEYEKSIFDYIDVKSGLEAVKRDAYIEGKADGISEGIAGGLAKGKAEAACNLLVMGLDIQTIVKATGLPEEEILKLRS